MTKDNAVALVLDYIKNIETEVGCNLVLLDNKTIERSFGWVFFYDSKQHIETGEIRHMLAGNAPLVVTRHDGKLHETGTTFPLSHYLNKFEGRAD